jgi:DNA polymerase-3 subunit alpha
VTDFCHLHLHSEYSLLDGYTKITDVPSIVSSYGYSSVAVTDHGSLAGAVKFELAAKEHGVKPIFGMEAYVSPILERSKDVPIWHLVLLAKNHVGLKNLFAISKCGWSDGFYKKPRVDHNILLHHNEGIIALSACMAGEVSNYILADDMDNAKAALMRYRYIYGDDFYVEIQPNNPQDLNYKLCQLADDLGLKTVVTVDAHYDHCENKSIEELLLLIQQVSGFKKSERDRAERLAESLPDDVSLMERLNLLWPNRGLRFDEHDLHIMRREEVVTALSKMGIDGDKCADATLEIADKCSFVSLKSETLHIPKLYEDSASKLRQMVFDGLRAKGLDNNDTYCKRAEEELAVIQKKNFVDYFLIVKDIIDEATRRNIYCGPGRGSVSGSLISYALGITSIDPIQFNLLFSRFINEERNDLPDIDMDFEHTRRDEMKQYMAEKYGDAVGIATFSEFKAKSLVRSICRVFCVPFSEQNEVCKFFDSLEEYEQSKHIVSFRRKYPEIGQLAKKLEGHISGTGMHAAGLVISDVPFEEIVPLESRVDPVDKSLRVKVSAFDMDDINYVGLVKLDFLGLNTLSVIHDCIDAIKQRHGVDIAWKSLPLDDQNVLGELAKGNTIGVFQMESSPYRKLLVEMGVDSFNDIVASNALVRPGALTTVAKSYIQRKKGLEKIDYPHESVIEFLEHTYGVYIYQEQVMQLAVHLGGFTWSEADNLRKIIGKKRDVAEFAKYYDKWMENASKKIGHEKAEKIWKDFEHHSNYSFNMSHAVAYGYMGYVTAWLKYYYPTEYMWSLLKHEQNDTNRMTYVSEASRLGIRFLMPDINKSSIDVVIEGENTIRFGLSDIKGIGRSICEYLINIRPFTSFDDFIERVEPKRCNAAAVDILKRAGAFESFGIEADQNDAPKLLNLPVSITDVDVSNISYIADIEENAFAIVNGFVKSLKKTPTYCRVEIEDSTGAITVFADDSCNLSAGEHIIALVGDKSLIKYERASNLSELVKYSPNIFTKFINNEPLFDRYNLLMDYGFKSFLSSKTMLIPLLVRELTTKAGKKMGIVYAVDAEYNIGKIIVWSSLWNRLKSRWQPDTVTCCRLRAKIENDEIYFVPYDEIVAADEILNKIQGGN